MCLRHSLKPCASIVTTSLWSSSSCRTSLQKRASTSWSLICKQRCFTLNPRNPTFKETACSKKSLLIILDFIFILAWMTQRFMFTCCTDRVSFSAATASYSTLLLHRDFFFLLSQKRCFHLWNCPFLSRLELHINGCLNPWEINKECTGPVTENQSSNSVQTAVILKPPMREFKCKSKAGFRHTDKSRVSVTCLCSTEMFLDTMISPESYCSIGDSNPESHYLILCLCSFLLNLGTFYF